LEKYNDFQQNKKDYIDLLPLADEQESMIEFLFSYYLDCKTMFVGTGDFEPVLLFYKSCGFKESHRFKNFFTDNYDYPIFEDGQQHGLFKTRTIGQLNI